MNVVDLFGGFGGFTEAATIAGARVVYAANHWELAVRVHRMNHPHVQHECQDLRQADWSRLPPYDVLLAAPACQGQSQCGQPARARSEDVRRRHDDMRSTAFAVIDCADVTEPRAIVVENVVDFARKWRLFPEWCAMLSKLGYHVSTHIELAADHGVPQLRRRLFIVATRKPFRMPLRAQARPAFGPCIEWDAGDWRPIAEASADARARIRHAKARCGKRCLSQHTTGHQGVPLHEPIRTITTKDQWIVVDGDRYRPLTLREYARAMGFRDSYVWPDELARAEVVMGLGNAVPPPMAADVVRAVLEAA